MKDDGLYVAITPYGYSRGSNYVVNAFDGGDAHQDHATARYYFEAWCKAKTMLFRLRRLRAITARGERIIR